MTAPAQPDPATEQAPAAPEPQNQPQEQPGATPPAPAEPNKDDEPLGLSGMKALQAERDARQELERQVKELAPLQEFANQIRAGKTASEADRTEAEKLAARVEEMERDLTTERVNRLRLEVANEKGLTSEQAARLNGSTREELTADADSLIALFPPAAPATPKPDPSQGARAPVDLDAQIEAAQKSGDTKTVIRLQNQKLANAK